MYKQCLLLNYRLITPLISHLAPKTAYGINRYTGRIGKALNRQSFRFDKRALPAGMDALTKYLNGNDTRAKEIINKFLLIETRVLLEHIWLTAYKLKYLPQIIDMNAMYKLSETINKNGSMLLLSAHTAYYFIIPWALYMLGNKIAYITTDPRANISSKHMLSGISCIDALSRLIPIIFTNEKNTVKKSIELLEKGYTVFMLIDIPGYKERGIKIRLFNKDLWVPSGCTWIFKGVHPNVNAVFSYVTDIRRPYKVIFSPVSANSEKIELQIWADKLEEVIKRSPESWLGWFYLEDMI